MLSDEKELIRDVQYKTIFRVYLSLLKRSEVSVKDVQKAMQFTTPAQAKYHLKRLAEMGLVSQTEQGNFKVTRRKFGLLRFFFEVKNRMIPMSVFYALFFAICTAVFYVRTPTLEVLLLGSLITVKEVVESVSYFNMV